MTVRKGRSAGAVTLRPWVAVVVALVWSGAGCYAFSDRPEAAPIDAPGEPIRIVKESRDNPPQRLWVVQVDVTDPRVRVRVVPGGADPDGPDGPYQTTLAPVSDIARREGLDLAFNASFFAVDKTGPWEGKGYTAGQPARAIGRTATDGRAWPAPERGDEWPVLWVDAEGRARVDAPANVPDDAPQVVAGNAWILREGRDAVPTQGMMTVRHPRTAVGVSADGRTLTILSVDGRQPGVASGMTGQEMRDELLKYGVHNAINLDGGGSTTVVQRDRAVGDVRVLNRPSDGRERPVANVIGITVASPAERK